MTGQDGRVRISVVTPTHNRPESLLRLLRALRDGTFPTSDVEAVIVADGCSDDSAARARAEPLPFAVRVLEQTPGRGAAAARNLGASVATGELVVFLDDDMEPFPALLAEHWREYQWAKVPTVTVGPPLPVRLPNAGLHAIAAWGWWERQFALMQRPGHRFTYDNVFSGNLSLPRALFTSVGGFDVEFNSCRDDSEFGLRVLRHGARVIFAPAAAARHHELRDTAALNQRKQAEGVADVRLARLYPDLWPALHLALPEQRPSRAFRAVRRLAFAAPQLGAVAAGALQGLLPMLEAARMRGTWRTLQAGLMYYWYWVGVARSLGSYAAFDALRAECFACATHMQAVADLEIDLAQGLESAEQALDAAQPAGATIRWGPLHVGRIAPHPGAEPLGGRHLRAVLASDLAQPLMSALAAATSAGSPVLRHTHLPAVSVIIPAYNAVDTLGATLDSLIDQTSPHWEAIIVDDGSTDDTPALAAGYAARDQRIRVLRQDQRGEGGARNSGLSEARSDWVLFLDADDWLLPAALERLVTAAAGDGTLDAVHGGWSRVAADGTVMAAEHCAHTGDLFALFARHCAFPIHSTLVRRSAAQRAGGFDAALTTCADWDFWQRLTRLGARFGRVPEVVARYRMRAGSPSTAVARLWLDGLRMIAQGHASDPRVSEAAHPNGAPKEQLSDARFEFACWVAGLTIGQGAEPSEVLPALAGEHDPGLNPEIAAHQLFRTVPLASARALDAWDELWSAVIPQIESFLRAIEQQSRARLFAQRAMRVLERLTLDVSRAPRPFTRGGTLAVEIDVSQPLSLVNPPAGVERAHCSVLASGSRIGTVLVPVTSDAEVNRRALATEVAARHAWPILGWFFGGGPYRDLVLQRGPHGISVLRHGVKVAADLSDAEAIDGATLHDRVGWTVFLQEFWGRPDWPADRFYEGRTNEVEPEPQRIDGPNLTIEVSAALPLLQLRSGSHSLELDVRVGGVPLGVASLPVSAVYVRPAELRAAITLQSAFALCRSAVQEGVLGRPRDAGGTLRERLARQAMERRRNESSTNRFPSMPNEHASASSASAFDRHHFETVFTQTTDPWSYVTPYEQLKYEQTLGLLPMGAIGRALELACAEGRFTRQLVPRVAELLASDISSVALERARAACSGMSTVQFVQLDLVKDPLPGPFDVIVCSEVLYYVGSTDALLAVGEKLRDALVPGGRLILAHTNVAIDDPAETALAWDVAFGAKRIGELLAQLPNVRFVHELRTELYRIQAFERSDDAPRAAKRSERTEPEVVEHAPHLPPAPHVAARFRRPHEPRSGAAPLQLPTTHQLPILMYHQVAPATGDGAPRMRYRVTPEAFASQLDYLKRAGFRSVALEDWCAAVHYRRPLPGRAVVLTFDDAYRDFGQHAFPLLQQYGFSAIVFVPCGFIGGTNAWEVDARESVPLLGWDELRDLATKGVAFGAHSMTHMPMTGLAAAAVIGEAAESKSILERGLGISVTAFAYPHGDNDAVVQQQLTACGYSVALSTRFGRAGFAEPLMALPRIEVTGHDDLATFIAKLGA